MILERGDHMGFLLALAVLIGLWLFLIAPGRSAKAARAPFAGRAFAHRGLYELDQSVPENSLEAFRRAVAAGYGAELDVQRTRDGQIVVFHDDSMKRACGVDKAIRDFTFEELQAFPLFGTEARIPLFSEVLRIFAGKQPLIVELKYGPDWELLSEATRRMLDEYQGPACVESFHPAMVRWFWRHDPQRLRGQLSEAACFSRQHVKWYLAFAMSRLLSNCLTRPQFIAYRLGPKPLSVRACEAMGAMKVLWTAREIGDHGRHMQENDAVIFEGYRPREGKAE